jgi:hypothetical protein
MVAEKSARDPDTYFVDATVIQESGLLTDEVTTYLGQLQGRNKKFKQASAVIGILINTIMFYSLSLNNLLE